MDPKSSWPIEIQYIGEDTAANVVVLDSRFLHLFDEVRENLPGLKRVIVVGDSAAPSAQRFEDLISSSTNTHHSADAALDDVVSIIYTSGTTGRPKGATQTHRSILSNDPAPGHLFCGNAHHVCLFAAGLRCHPA